MSAARPVDWERIQIEYRAGTKSVREIAAAHGLSHTAINKRAKEHSWPRDLKAIIRAKADAKVSRALVSAEVSEKTKITETITIEAESDRLAGVKLTQRKNIARGSKLVMDLLAELEAQTANPALMQQLAEIMVDPEQKGSEKLQEAFQKAMSLGARVATVKTLSDAMRNLIAMERQAFGMDDPEAPSVDGPVLLSDEDLDAKINERLKFAGR